MSAQSDSPSPDAAPIGRPGLLDRRAFLWGSAAAAMGLATGTAMGAAPAVVPKVSYGAAVRGALLASEPDYVAALLKYCAQIVGEGGLNWYDIRPTQGQFVFDEPDAQLAFAEAHNLPMRGHALVWYGAMPDWTAAIATANEAHTELVGHIQKVAGRYKGRIKSWDAINEPIPDKPGKPTELRDSIWTEKLGYDYVEIALRATAEVDPDAQLVINDYDVEFVGDRYKAKRAALLALVRDLKDKDVPLHAVGLQGHLRGEVEIDKHGLSTFVDALKGMGVDVLVTELDVVDDKLPALPAKRDAAAAGRAKDFLDAITAAATPTAILTWGITDKYTWVPTWYKRGDGLPNRPLPLDASYQPKALMQTLQHYSHGPA